MMRGAWWTVGLALLQVSCGTMLNGSKQSVRVSSIPPGATVEIDEQTYRTPISLELDRGRNYEVTAHMDGFEPSTDLIQSQPDSYVKFLNCIFFLCIPQLWESDEPCQHRLEPEQLELMLNPTGWSPR